MIPQPKDLIRFFSKVKLNGTCWEWKYSLDTSGYGLFGYNKRLYKSHRFSFELFKGEIPQGYEIDHLCRNRICVNPEHLDAVTHHDNVKRGMTGKLNNWEGKKTHCPKGHPLTIENIYHDRWIKYGKRTCVKCHRNYALINSKIKQLMRQDFMVI